MTKKIQDLPRWRVALIALWFVLLVAFVVFAYLRIFGVVDPFPGGKGHDGREVGFWVFTSLLLAVYGLIVWPE